MAEKNSPKIKTVAFYAHHKPQKEAEERLFMQKLIRFFYKQGITKIYGDDRSIEILHNGTIEPIQEDKKYDLKIALGGDGTIRTSSWC